MKFNLEKLKEISRPLSEKEKAEAEFREQNRDWLAVSEKLALKLRYVLRTENISQAELAKRMGVTPAQVTKILSGKENLGLKTICKIEKAIGISLIDISINDSLQDYVAQKTTIQVVTIPIFVKSDAVSKSSNKANTFTSLLVNNNMC